MTIDDLDEKIDVLARNFAVFEERHRNLLDKINDLRETLEKVEKELNDLHQLSNRWKGGFVVLAGLGGVLGVVLSAWDSIRSILGGLFK